MSKKDEITMEDVEKSSFRLRRGQMVEGTVYKVEDNLIYVTLENNQEAKMYLEYYGKSIDSFKEELQEGDKIQAIISQIIDDERAGSSIYLDRKKIVNHANYEKVEDIYKNEEIIEAKIIRVDDKGLHLNVHGFTAFLPYGLLDHELIKKKEELKGQKLDVHIIEVKPGRRPRIIASRKIIYEERRAQERAEYQAKKEEELANINTGDVVTGTITKIFKHMALVKFEYNVGRLRISQISHLRIDNIKDVLKVGEEVTVRVLKKDKKSLDLSMKALLPTPIEEFSNKHQKGDTVKGLVNQKLPFGLVLELEERVRALLHRSEYSWNPDDNFHDYVKIGDEVEVVLKSVDVKKEKIRVSRRLLLDNPWDKISFKVDEEVECKVLEVNENGLVVEAKGVNGFIPNRELSKDRVEDPATLFAIDDKVNAIVTSVNPERWHLRLSIRILEIRKEKASYEAYLTQEEPDPITIGDLFEELNEEIEKEKEENNEE